MNSQSDLLLACVETDLIYQVFVHELVHAYRLCQLKIKTFKDYIVYNNLLCNVIYEEIVASSLRKVYLVYYLGMRLWEVNLRRYIKRT